MLTFFSNAKMHNDDHFVISVNHHDDDQRFFDVHFHMVARRLKDVFK